MVGMINKNLVGIEYSTWDESSIEISDDKTEYDLPVAAKRAAARKQLRVWLEGDDSDSDDQRWTEVFNWRIEPSGAAGSADTLILQYQYASGYAIGLEYTETHAEIRTDSSKLDEKIPWETVVYPAILDLLWWKQGQFDPYDYKEETTIALSEDAESVFEYRINWDRYKADKENVKTLIVKYESMVADIKVDRVTSKPKTPGRLLTLGATGELDSEPNKVYL